ncbi:DUF881 domain-containing protein [Clostridiisalibacter paucivorans]|uniref:DUF881 domain-containing protein n=1 Tax=Clostridiisalibacter paucivorans TaxID=408753 RepID=UPI00047EE3E7|nr:DUF881 domain-containing protein [Clostridiisalibacter paucivorans]
MKKSFLNKGIIFILSVGLGVLLPIQLRHNVEDNIFVTIDSIQAMKNEITKNREEIDDINKLIEKKKKELENIEAADNKGDITDVLKNELYKVKVLAGYEDLEGPGILIRIEDNDEKYNIGEDIDDQIVHDTDILNLLNDLKVAGAEAISIKGQRVLVNSEIQCGGPIIWINKRAVTAPFVIKAIGDPKVLYASINAPGTYGYVLKNDYNIKMRTDTSDYILISRKQGDLSLEYIKPVKEGE